MRQPPPRLNAASPKTLTEVKRKEEVPVNGPVYPFNGLGYQPSLAIAYPYFPPASAAALPAAVYNQMPINQNVQAGFDKNGQPWKPHFKFVQPSITTTTTTTTTTTATTTTVTTPTPSTTTTTTSASTERIVEEDNATSVGEPVAAMLQHQLRQLRSERCKSCHRADLRGRLLEYRPRTRGPHGGLEAEGCKAKTRSVYAVLL